MKYWSDITPKHAVSFFGVPENIAHEVANQFWGTRISKDGYPVTYDGPRQFIALIPLTTDKSVVRLCYNTIDDELFYMEGDAYNVFESPFGRYLDLSAESLDELSTRLADYSKQTTDDGNHLGSIREITIDDPIEKGLVLQGSNTIHYFYELDTVSETSSSGTEKKLLTIIDHESSKTRSLECRPMPEADEIVDFWDTLSSIVLNKRGLEVFSNFLATLNQQLG